MEATKRIYTRSPLLIPTLAFVVGIIMFVVSSSVWIPLALAISSCMLCSYTVMSRKTHGLANICLFCMLFASLGGLDAWINSPVGKYAVQGAERLEGSVIESKTTVSGAAMTVDIDKALFPGKTSKTISGMRILLYTDGRAIRPGNLISLPSRLEEIGRLPFFDSQRYAESMRKNGILYSVRSSENEVSSHGEATGMVPAAARARDRVEATIWESRLAPSTKAFMEAIITGDRNMVDSNTKQSFADAGIAHLLALSGLHLGIIAAILAVILLPLNLVIHYKYRFIILIILLWTFTVFTGSGPATVRACVMATVFYFELILERPHSRFNSLSAAALAILVIRPYDLFNPAFQLSISCVASIMIFTPLLNPLRQHEHPRLHSLAALTISSLIAAVGSCLITAYYFDRLTILSLLTNIIVIPLMAPLLVLSAVCLLSFVAGIDIIFLEKLQDMCYGCLQAVSQWGQHAGSEFSPPAEAAVLWSIGLLLLAVAAYSKRRGWIRFVPAYTALAGAVAMAVIVPRTKEEGVIISQSHGITEINYRYEDIEGSESYMRGASGFSVHDGKRYAIIQKPLYRLSGYEISQIRRCHIIILAGNCKGSIKDLITPSIKPTIILGPYLRQQTRDEISSEASSIGLSIHSLRESGPLRLTRHI